MSRSGRKPGRPGILYAIGLGGLLGLGLGNPGRNTFTCQSPRTTLFFAIVCEELGLIGALIIIILFALLVWRGISISLKAKDKFGSLLGIGLSAQVGLQVILNIAVVTNTIPNTGISLPFFSYGASLVILLAQMGVVLSISRTSMIERGSALAGLSAFAPFLSAGKRCWA